MRAQRVALATNVFRSLVPRYRLLTVPVYDYALMTEPLSDEQLASIGWSGRQGLGDSANLFHYYRLTADNRILWGGYDAVYHFGRRVKDAHESRPQTHRLLAEHFFTTFPQLEGLRFSHQWAGAIDTSTRFCAFYGLARQGRVAYAAGFTGLGVGATRFAADVMLDLLSGESTPRTELEMVRRKPLPFPPEPIASIGIQTTRWALERADRREGRRNLWLRALDAAGLGFRLLSSARELGTARDRPESLVSERPFVARPEASCPRCSSTSSCSTRARCRPAGTTCCTTCRPRRRRCCTPGPDSRSGRTTWRRCSRWT